MYHRVITNLVDKGKLREGSVLAYITNQAIQESGVVTRDGVICLCQLCGGEKTIPVSTFEIHAHSGHRKPSKYIFLHDDSYGGYRKSLGMLNSEGESQETGEPERPPDMGESSRHVPKTSTGTCDLCLGRGDVFCCSTQGCPAALHMSCSAREPLADGRWYCQKCSCRECQSPLCERTAFCSVLEDTLVNSEQWNPLVNCDQCGDSYHKECLMKRTKHPISFQSFCSTTCEQMSGTLGELVKPVLHPGAPLPLTWVKWSEELLLSFLDNPGLDTDTLHTLGILKAVCAQKLFGAKNILKSNFEDESSRTGSIRTSRIEILQKMLYNHRSTERDLGNNGFYVVLIEEDRELTASRNQLKVIREAITVATIRIHSQKVAEMPFIATLESHRGLHYCSKLMNPLYEVLKLLGVLKWVVQSPPEFVEMWTEKFSFHPVNIPTLRSLLDSNLLKLEQTTLLCKDVEV